MGCGSLLCLVPGLSPDDEEQARGISPRAGGPPGQNIKQNKKNKRTARGGPPYLWLSVWHLFVCPVGVPCMSALSRAQRSRAHAAIVGVLLLLMTVSFPPFPLHYTHYNRQDRRIAKQVTGCCDPRRCTCCLAFWSLAAVAPCSPAHPPLLLCLGECDSPFEAEPGAGKATQHTQQHTQSTSTKHGHVSQTQRSSYIHEHHNTRQLLG